ncbi:PucR family transcriptional regulator [Arthrobacter mobilis]|uniref:PucR family transcriptional regulator n=1 Tax=Arthrobacter mobilis TaxID=2724944 RepID=A0A7X6HF80_9MICC|nr:PucR family transcriptional regulator [Arthrobacter mobilis]NKX56052.1 PucR family transcriptional regulator [Arthrobacter mobilis]
MIVADLLAEDTLQLRLHTPSSATRLDSRISWCAPTEVTDPTPWLSRNVLVLTNGIGLQAGDDRTWQAYVERLAAVPVSAVAFGTGTAHRLLPPGLVKAATRLDIPLLEIPRAVSFLQVHRYVTNVLQAEHYAARTRSWQLAEACSRHAASGASVRTILAEVGRNVGAPVAIMDGSGSVLAQWPAAVRWTGEDLRRAAMDDDERAVPLPMGGGSFQLVTRGKARDEPLATLLAPAASIIAVQLRSALQTTSHKQAQLQALLLEASDWQGVALEKFAGTFRSTGLEADQPTLIVTAALEEGRLADVWKIRLALQEVFEVLRMTVLGDLVVAVAQRPGAGSAQACGDGSLTASLTELFRSVVPDLPVVLKGLSNSPGELRLSLHHAVRLVREVSGPVMAADLDLDSVLAVAADQGARAGARKLLAPVVAYDQQHTGALLATLRTYLDSDCHPSRTCHRLFIHRNTLAQRIRKLESLLQVRLDTLEGQTACLMALHLQPDLHQE